MELDLTFCVFYSFPRILCFFLLQDVRKEREVLIKKQRDKDREEKKKRLQSIGERNRDDSFDMREKFLITLKP